MGSIQAAQSAGPLGGLIVSAHFARLTHPYLESGKGTPEQRAQVEEFLLREAARVERLLPQAGLPVEEIEALITVLQFCDLASLYSVRESGELRWSCRRCSTEAGCSSRFENGAFRMRPNLLDHVLVLEIPCVRWVDGKAEREMVPVKVQ